MIVLFGVRKDPLYRDGGEHNAVDDTQTMYPYDRPILRRAKISMLDYTKAVARGAYGSSGVLTGVEVPE